jgi:hemerythrin
MALQWTQALSVGDDEIDAQHRELFRRAARLLDGIKRGEPEEIGALVDFLHEYAVTHFGAEEAWMRDVHYGGYAEHKAEHDRFVKDILRMSDEHERRGGPGLEALRIGTYLSRWLTEHVTSTDAALPNGDAFWTRSASSTSLARMITSTGPNTSSCAIAISGVTWSMIVGPT